MRISLSSRVKMIVKQKIEAMTPMLLLPSKTPTVVEQTSEKLSNNGVLLTITFKESLCKKIPIYMLAYSTYDLKK